MLNVVGHLVTIGLLVAVLLVLLTGGTKTVSASPYVAPVAAVEPTDVLAPGVNHPTRTLRLCSRFGVERAEQVIHVADWPVMVVHAGVVYRPHVPTWSDFATVAEYREA